MSLKEGGLGRRGRLLWDDIWMKFLRPLVASAELIKEFAFGLLHAPCGIGVADGAGHALERGQAETDSKVLCWFGKAEQTAL
jgi:hypothetical protein